QRAGSAGEDRRAPRESGRDALLRGPGRRRDRRGPRHQHEDRRPRLGSRAPPARRDARAVNERIDTEYWKRVDSLLEAALALPPGERRAWVDRLGADQQDFKATLIEMLARA